MPINWNHQADAKLLIAILKTSKPKVDHDAVAKYMGKECSAYAVQHRIRKLQAIARGVDEKDSPTPSTPSKPRTVGSSRSTPRSTAGKRKSAPEEQLKDTEETDHDGERRLKKRAKNEEDDEYVDEEHV